MRKTSNSVTKKPQQDAAGTYAAPSQELPDGFEEIEVPDEDLPF
jgi:hypothetical protein